MVSDFLLISLFLSCRGNFGAKNFSALSKQNEGFVHSIPHLRNVTIMIFGKYLLEVTGEIEKGE